MSTTTTFEVSMSEGHAAMQAGDDEVALRHFKLAGTHTQDATESSMALQMCCVVLNKLGRMLEAIEFGDAALAKAIEVSNYDQMAHSKRDLAAAHHKQAVRLALRRERDPEYERGPKYSREHFMTAHRHYNDARRYYGKTRDSAAYADDNDVLRKYTALGALTRGMHALMLFDMDTHCSLAVGDKAKARRMLRDADAELRSCEAEPAWQLNTLIRLMRVSNPLVRIRLLGRGLALTSANSASPGSRDKVLAALAGNDLCNWAMFRNLEVTDQEIADYQRARLAA